MQITPLPIRYADRPPPQGGRLSQKVHCRIRLSRQITKALHLLAMRVDDALDLLRREDFLPLSRSALAEKSLGFLGAFLETCLFFLLA